MTISEDLWPYWSVDLPGLNRSRAEELLAMADQAGMSNGGSVVDPSRFLTLHMDKLTVESLLRALSSATTDIQVADSQVVAGIVEIMREWNEAALSQ